MRRRPRFGPEKDRNFNAAFQNIASDPVCVNRVTRGQSSRSPRKTRSRISIVCACGQLGGGILPLSWPQARLAPDERVCYERACSSCALARDTLIELVVRCGLRLRIEGVRSAVLHLPQRRTTRRHQAWR